jgi:hypothetical protein
LRKLDGEVPMQDDDLVASSAERPFAGVADIQALMATKDASRKDRLWTGVEETGLNVAVLPEDLGGTGLGLHYSLGILRIAGGASSRHKLPAWIGFVDTLPMTSTNKIQKHALLGPDKKPTSRPGIFDLRARKSRMATQN